MSKIISEKVLFQGRWLNFVEIEYETRNAERLTWECIRRSQLSSSVVVIARLNPSQRFVLIKQYRPAAGGYILGFPAGLSDGRPEDALRELKEETGYTGVIRDISPPLCSHAGVMNDGSRAFFVDVDENDPVNRNPVQELEPSEDITVYPVKASDVRQFIQEQSAAGVHISPGLWYMFGWTAEYSGQREKT